MNLNPSIKNSSSQGQRELMDIDDLLMSNPLEDLPLILIVDDEKTMRMLLKKAMEKEGYRVAEATDGKQGIELYQSLNPDIVLLDAMMPLMDGFTCCEKMQALPGSDRTPILIITALEDSESVDRAYKVGAADYVTKPIHWAVLRQRVRRLIQQVSLLTQLENANRELQRLATLDGLTGLANRRCFDRVLDYEWRCGIREAWQSPNPPQLSLILGDVDFFKNYNDTYGHQAGDSCLQQIARAMSRVAKRPPDLVARYGGEEFAVILPRTNVRGAIHVAQMIRSEVRKSAIAHACSQVSEHVTLSLGVASTVPSRETNLEMLIAAADAALYEAKKQGRDRVVCNSQD